MEFNLTIVVGGFSFLIDKWNNSFMSVMVPPEGYNGTFDTSWLATAVGLGDASWLPSLCQGAGQDGHCPR